MTELERKRHFAKVLCDPLQDMWKLLERIVGHRVVQQVRVGANGDLYIYIEGRRYRYLVEPNRLQGTGWPG